METKREGERGIGQKRMGLQISENLTTSDLTNERGSFVSQVGNQGVGSVGLVVLNGRIEIALFLFYLLWMFELNLMLATSWFCDGSYRSGP